LARRNAATLLPDVFVGIAGEVVELF